MVDLQASLLQPTKINVSVEVLSVSTQKYPRSFYLPPSLNFPLLYSFLSTPSSSARRMTCALSSAENKGSPSVTLMRSSGNLNE